MEIKRWDSITDIDATQWDNIAGDDTLGTHDWLRLVEESGTEGARFLYLTVHHNDRLVGGAACQSRSASSESTSLNRMLFGRVAPVARRIGLGATPAITVGSRNGISQPFLIDRTLPESERRSVAAALLEGILDESRRAGATIIVRNANGDTPVDALERAGFHSSPELPSAYLDVRWPTFAVYRNRLKKAHAATERAIRQEYNRAKQRGLAITRITDPSLVTDEMYDLLDTHYRRLNGVPMPFGKSFLERALTLLGERAVVITVRDSTDLLGVNFRLRHAGIMRSLFVGIDQGKGRETATYFVLMNDSVQASIESGDRRLYFGRMMYEVKLRRGCSIDRSTMWIRGKSPVQRSLLRSFIGLRTRKLEKTIAPLERVSSQNAAVMGRA